MVRHVLSAIRLPAMVLILAVHGMAASAQDSAPRFPQPKISEAEWATFLAEVKAKPGAQDASRPERPDILAIAVEPEATMYYFTRSGSAHPAVVIGRVVQRDGAVLLHHSGYFAGNEQAFAQWFKSFAAQADNLRRSMENTAPRPAP